MEFAMEAGVQAMNSELKFLKNFFRIRDEFESSSQSQIINIMNIFMMTIIIS